MFEELKTKKDTLSILFYFQAPGPKSAEELKK